MSALIAADGTIVRSGGRQLHENDGPTAVIGAVLRNARDCLSGTDERPARVGVSVAAQVDSTAGRVVHAPNLGWRDVPLGPRVAEGLGLPVVVANDARAATMGEWRHGEGVGAANLFFLALGTGVGGSAVLGGELVEGGAHAFGEVGHLTVVSGGRRCHCPNSGCLEAYVGGWAIAERAQESARADPSAAVGLVSRAGVPERITAQTVFDAYRAGDLLANRLVRETERFLADGAVSIVNAFDPGLLVLGGGLTAGMPEFAGVVESAVRTRCQPPASDARIAVSRLGENAALVGVADIARARSP